MPEQYNVCAATVQEALAFLATKKVKKISLFLSQGNPQVFSLWEELRSPLLYNDYVLTILCYLLSFENWQADFRRAVINQLIVPPFWGFAPTGHKPENWKDKPNCL